MDLVNEVAIWAFNLDQIDTDAIVAVLAGDERDRAARFRFDKHRYRYIAARGALRSVLSSVTGHAAADLVFEYGEHGKPSLPGQGLEFNLSHSENWALVGATLAAAPIGVDIEKVNPDRSNPDIARRFFAEREIEELEGLAPDAYTKGFFNCWARKEAVLKAVGTGISGGLSSFAVPVDAMLEPVQIPEPECCIWNLANLFPYLEAEAFSMALTVLGNGRFVRPVCGTVLRIPVRRTLKI